MWGIKDFRDLYQITKNGENVEILLILYQVLIYVEILLNISKWFEILLNISEHYGTRIVTILIISIN